MGELAGGRSLVVVMVSGDRCQAKCDMGQGSCHTLHVTFYFSHMFFFKFYFYFLFLTFLVLVLLPAHIELFSVYHMPNVKLCV